MNRPVGQERNVFRDWGSWDDRGETDSNFDRRVPVDPLGRYCADKVDVLALH